MSIKHHMCLIDQYVSKLSNQSFVQTDIHAFSNSEFRLQKYHIYASTTQTKHLILYYMKDSVINYTCTHVYTFQVQRSSTVQRPYIHTHTNGHKQCLKLLLCVLLFPDIDLNQMLQQAWADLVQQ